MSYVSYNYTKILVDYANKNHLISKSFLEENIIYNYRYSKNNQKIIGLDDYIQIILEVLKHIKIDNLLINLVKQYKLSSHGYLGLLGYCSYDIKSAIDLMVKYAYLEWPIVKYTFSVLNEEYSIIEIHDTIPLINHDIKYFIYLKSLLTPVIALNDILGENLITDISFVGECPINEYKKYFNYLNISPNCENNLIKVKRKLLNNIHSNYNEHTFNMMLNEIQKL